MEGHLNWPTAMPEMTLAEAQSRTEEFLTQRMPAALRTVDYSGLSFDREPRPATLTEAARAEVDRRHVRGASDCIYLIAAFGDELLMQLQLNVWRLVAVYRVPAIQGLDVTAVQPRLERWQRGAEHAGWTVGWREAANPHDRDARYVETYCYAAADRSFLANEIEQLYWRTDIVQMTRYFMLEAQRCGVALSPRRAGYEL
jgi:hypothetical protein